MSPEDIKARAQDILARHKAPETPGHTIHGYEHIWEQKTFCGVPNDYLMTFWMPLLIKDGKLVGYSYQDWQKLTCPHCRAVLEAMK